MTNFQRFYTEHREKLFGYLLRRSGNPSLAADLVQESFTRYLERYRDRGNNPALLFTIGRNLFYDQMRRDRHLSPEQPAAEPTSPDQESRYLAGEQSRKLTAALAMLADEERDILSLVTSSELSYRQIGEIRGCSESNIKVKVHRARKKLRQLLEEGEHG